MKAAGRSLRTGIGGPLGDDLAREQRIARDIATPHHQGSGGGGGRVHARRHTEAHLGMRSR